MNTMMQMQPQYESESKLKVQDDKQVATLASYFLYLSSHEKQVEVCKEILFEQHELMNNTSYQKKLFKFLDQFSRGFLVPYDLKDFLQKLAFSELPPSISEVEQLMEYYSSKSGGGRMDFDDFQLLILPKYKHRLVKGEEGQQQHLQDPDQLIKSEVLYAVSRILSKEVEFIQQRAAYIRSLDCGNLKFDFERVFREMDVSNSGYINIDKMHSYLLRMPGMFSSRDAEAIVDRVTIQKDSIQGFDLKQFSKLFNIWLQKGKSTLSEKPTMSLNIQIQDEQPETAKFRPESSIFIKNQKQQSQLNQSKSPQKNFQKSMSISELSKRSNKENSKSIQSPKPFLKRVQEQRPNTKTNFAQRENYKSQISSIQDKKLPKFSSLKGSTKQKPIKPISTLNAVSSRNQSKEKSKSIKESKPTLKKCATQKSLSQSKQKKSGLKSQKTLTQSQSQKDFHCSKQLNTLSEASLNQTLKKASLMLSSGKKNKENLALKSNLKSGDLERKQFSTAEKCVKFNEDIVESLAQTDEQYKEVKDIFLSIIQKEKGLQLKKQQLAKRSGFNLVDAFKIISTQRTNDRNQDIIDRDQLKCFFKNNVQLLGQQFDFNDQNLYLLMRRMDKKFRGYISFQEFVNEFLPLDENYSHLILQRLPRLNPEGKNPLMFEQELMKEYVGLWLDIVNVENEMEIVKKKVRRVGQSQLQDVFTEIDKTENRRIFDKDLGEFLKPLLGKVSQLELDLSIKYLMSRLTRDQKDSVSYVDFIDELLPRLQ